MLKHNFIKRIRSEIMMGIAGAIVAAGVTLTVWLLHGPLLMAIYLALPTEALETLLGVGNHANKTFLNSLKLYIFVNSLLGGVLAICVGKLFQTILSLFSDNGGYER